MRRLAVLALLVAAAPAQGALRFEREDGTAIAMPGGVRVWCGPFAADVAQPALHVAVRPQRPRYWALSVVRRDLLRGQAFTFPNPFLWDHPKGALLFALDRPNELSTAEEEAGGRLFFSRISCRPGHVVAFRIRATLGSEVSGPTVRVTGRFRGRVAGIPPTWASSAS